MFLADRRRAVQMRHIPQSFLMGVRQFQPRVRPEQCKGSTAASDRKSWPQDRCFGGGWQMGSSRPFAGKERLCSSKTASSEQAAEKPGRANDKNNAIAHTSQKLICFFFFFFFLFRCQDIFWALGTALLRACQDAGSDVYVQSSSPEHAKLLTQLTPLLRKTLQQTDTRTKERG